MSTWKKIRQRPNRNHVRKAWQARRGQRTSPAKLSPQSALLKAMLWPRASNKLVVWCCYGTHVLFATSFRSS
eukprot:8579599-Pyramimonas_sp.AAC.1